VTSNNELFLSIVIPVYNEEKSIEKVVEEITLIIPQISEDVEIVIIDDGSKDKTADIVINLKEKNKNISFYQHPRNKGKGTAVRTGIEKAKGKFVLIQDADMEYFPGDIPSLIQPIIDGKTEVVYGNRFQKLSKPPGMKTSHYLGNKLLSLITTVLFFRRIKDMETGYKIFPRNLYKNLNIKAQGFDFEPELTSKILRKRKRILEIPIHYEFRKEGKAKITWKDGLKAVWVLLKFRFVRF